MSNTWFRLRRGFFLSFFPSDTPHYENVLPDGWCLTDIGELLINRDGERKPVSSVIRSKQTSKIYDYYGAAGVIDKVDSYLFDERLLLIGEDGANLLSRSKNNAFFAEGRYWVNNHAHVLDATDKNLLDFIAIVINSMKLDDYITGSAQPKLSQDNLNKIPIVLPPLAEQQRIIAEIKKWFTLIDQIEQDKADLQTTIKLTKSKILDLAIHGRGAASITRILIAEKVPTPGFINFQRDGTFANIYAGAPEEKSYAWTIAQVKSIMKDETYIGHTIHYRETNISFKNKRRVRKPQSEWVRVENTQEPIISEQVFRQVQEQIANRRRKCKDGTTQIFSGLVKCADCGWSLSYGENRQNSKPYGHYHCSKYGQGTRQCSMHYIRYDVLYAYVLSRLQYWSVLAQQDGDKLLKRLLNASDKERNTARKRQTAELKKAEKRKAEVDTLFAKMYEDWSAGRITEYNFNMLSEKYQGEQRELDAKIERLHEAMEAAAQTAVDAEKWIGLMKQYVNPTELTAELLNTLIEKILVHEAVKSEDGSREQEVEIFYRFIGKIE